MTLSEKQKAIEDNHLYGRVICRCETVTEGEIVDAIHEPVGARTLDRIERRRTRAGMGRCGEELRSSCDPDPGPGIADSCCLCLKGTKNSHLYYEKFTPEVEQ